MPSRWEVEETVRFKDLYDQDKDGKLNREEQLRWVAPNSYGSAREEVTLDSEFLHSVGKARQMNIIIPWNETVNAAVLQMLQLSMTSRNHLRNCWDKIFTRI